MTALKKLFGASLISLSSAAFAQIEDPSEDNLNSLDVLPRYMTTDPDTIDFWVDELSWVKDIYGFVPNPDKRSQNLLRNRAPLWSDNHDFVADDTAISPALENTDIETRFDTALNNLGAINNLLYNAGTSHILINSGFDSHDAPQSLDRITDEETRKNAIGLFISWNNQAYTAFPKLSPPQISLERVAQHEAAHAFAFSISPLRVIGEVMEDDYQQLSDKQKETLPDIFKNNYLAVGMALAEHNNTDERITLFLLQQLEINILNNPEISALFPNTLHTMNIIGIRDQDPWEFYHQIDHHRRIWENFYDDLGDIVQQNRPDGARLVIEKTNIHGNSRDIALILADGKDGQDHEIIMHSVFREFYNGEIGQQNTIPEGFAEVFATAQDGCEIGEMCYYFPRTTKEVLGIINAMEVLAEQERLELETQTPGSLAPH